MAKIRISGNSPGAPSPIKLQGWDEDFQQIDPAVTRESPDNGDPTVYDDRNDAVTQKAAEEIAWGWNVSIT